MQNKIIKAGTKIFVGAHTGYAGMDAHEGWIFSVDMTHEDIDEEVWLFAKQHAEFYGIYPREEYIDEEDVDIDDECYSDNIEGWWELYDEAKHEAKLSYGKGPQFTTY